MRDGVDIQEADVSLIDRESRDIADVTVTKKTIQVTPTHGLLTTEQGATDVHGCAGERANSEGCGFPFEQQTDGGKRLSFDHGVYVIELEYPADCDGDRVDDCRDGPGNYRVITSAAVSADFLRRRGPERRDGSKLVTMTKQVSL